MVGWQRWLRLAAILAAVVLLYFVVPVDQAGAAGEHGRAVGALLIFGLLALAVVYQLRVHLDDTSRRWTA